VIFVDTGFFFALLSEDDPDHTRATEVFETFEGQRLPDLLITTNHVVFETITLARARAGHALAVEAGDMLYSEKLARIHHATAGEEAEAFEYLRKYRDKDYSAVDCLSFVLMDKLGITEALAVDSDFGHRFLVRPGRPTR
jgi:predicted nucleic acid-binding protein